MKHGKHFPLVTGTFVLLVEYNIKWSTSPQVFLTLMPQCLSCPTAAVTGFPKCSALNNTNSILAVVDNGLYGSLEGEY